MRSTNVFFRLSLGLLLSISFCPSCSHTHTHFLSVQNMIRLLGQHATLVLMARRYYRADGSESERMLTKRSPWCTVAPAFAVLRPVHPARNMPTIGHVIVIMILFYHFSNTDQHQRVRERASVCAAEGRLDSRRIQSRWGECSSGPGDVHRMPWNRISRC